MARGHRAVAVGVRQLSNHVGRRPVVSAAVAFSIGGCFVLEHVHTLPMLVGGRVLQGLAYGIALSVGSVLVSGLFHLAVR